MTMRTAGRGRRSGALVGVLLAGLVVSGCSGDGSGGSGGSGGGAKGSGSGASSAGAGGSASAGTPGRSPSAYPVAASATPVPLPSLGSRSNGRFRLDLNGVRRSGTDALLVTATVTNVTNTNWTFVGFEEPGYAMRKQPDGKLAQTDEFSAVTLTVPGSATQYQVMRDPAGSCACTQGLLSVDAGISHGVYAYVTAPPGATTVTVNVQGFAPFPNVPVAS